MASPRIYQVANLQTELTTTADSANNRVLRAGDTMTGELNVANNLVVTGNVGIGTATPSESLDVLGKVTVNSDGTLNWGNAKDFGKLTWSFGGIGNPDKAVIRAESGKALSLGANGNQDYLLVSTSGNVGIGTINPGSKLHILDSTGPVIRMVRTSNRFDIVADNDAMEFVSRDSAAANLIITGFSNVGIGLTNPSSALTVNGVITVTSVAPLSFIGNNNTGTWNRTVVYVAQNNTSGSLENGIFIERGRITDSNAAEIRNFVIGSRGGQTQFIVTGPGNVGIQTTSPSCALDVVSTNAIRIPEGTTAQRPTPATGMIRFNSSLRIFEGYSSAGKWEVIPTAQARFLNGSPSPISSTTNTTFRDMRTFTYTANGPKIISVGIIAFNDSGAYYWTWRLYNSSKSAPVPILDCSPLPDNDVANGGGIAFLGGVHNSSAQPYVNFDMSGASDGDTIAIQMSNHTTGGGSVGGLVSSTQQLHLNYYLAFHGIVTGMSGTAYWST